MMDDIKNMIIKGLKQTSMDIDLMCEYLNMSKSDVLPYLDELESEKKIRKTKKNGVYKINKERSAFTLEAHLDDEFLLHVIKELRHTDIYSIMQDTKASKKDTKEALAKLVDRGEIRYIKEYSGEYFTCPIEARIIVTEAGYIKAAAPGDEKLYYISDDNRGSLYDGDIAYILPLDFFEHTATVDKIIERGHTRGVGLLKKKKRKSGEVFYYIESTIKKFEVWIDISADEVGNAVPDMIVTADLEYLNNGRINGHNLRVIGHKDDPGMEISKIALEFGFNLEFPDDVREEVKSIPSSVTEAEIRGRKDWRDLNIITIDGDDSKDFDDAVYLDYTKDGNYKLGVFIADVSHYVREGMPLDKEGFKRGTSLYLADRVIPMLPHELSNGICSLNPDVDRLVLACIMEIDQKGKLVNYDISEGVIRSHHRMTYNNVNKILNDDKELCEEYSDIVPMLKEMEILSKKIRELRTKRGGIEFDSEEYSFVLNPDGSPKKIVKRERAYAEKLIEDFMLMANETVAYHMNIMNLPIVYRIHEKPDQSKLHNTLSDVKAMGLNIKMTQNDIHPKQLQEILEEAKENPNALIINNMILRSMMKAKYSEQCLGHYGLAMNYYCHFTSPIRRYPDLMTHRMIKKLLLHPGNSFERDLKYYQAIMPEVGIKTSSSEKRSVECEREVDDMLYAWYMESNIGQSYHGIITSITSFGMFITIGNGIEGLFLYKNSRHFFDYNEKSKTAVSESGNVYSIGDKVSVRCRYSSKEDRRIDFDLEEGVN
ncbi:MAG: ribonuclease R [Acholeplasmatales bacterium]|nr:ribonuclease R [Acholeplasmatales bacterium]